MKNIIEHFNNEAKIHDNNFINNMGMSEFYDEIETQLNKIRVKNNILVLGCGTGLEIERIKFKANVVAVDISKEMLNELKKKNLYPEISLKTICGSFLDLNFGKKNYDIVLSCYTMHHFNETQKVKLYSKILNSLSDSGVFLNGDITRKRRDDEIKKYNEAIKIYEEKSLTFGSLHIDIPFCYEHELEVLQAAGFKNVTLERKWEHTKLYRAAK